MHPMARARSSTTQFNTRLPDDLYQWLRATAEARCCSIQYLLSKAVERLRESIPEVPV